jgi:hypothetical protein
MVHVSATTPKPFISHLHVFCCVIFAHIWQRKQGQSWIPKVSNAYSLIMVKGLKDDYKLKIRNGAWKNSFTQGSKPKTKGG